eukprot:NODE_27513_length_511_cov_0.531250.p3 GENE.NODE_27513_length_511_cov_0.531250~~NODE_27513_length_511_cov_0.531250.p3  ORF type:complete len:53 (+),score=2.33 NODE_27513_length_511_cov_0.531250:213-371(+)
MLLLRALLSSIAWPRLFKDHSTSIHTRSVQPLARLVPRMQSVHSPWAQFAPS